MTHDKIAVVDFGGQYAHLIATKIRRLHVLAEIRQPEDATDLFAEYKGIVLSGSPSLSAFGEDSVYNKSIYDLDVPILGFCFGHQEIAKHYGGEVIHGGREWGAADLHVVRDHPLFTGLARREPVWMSHFDSVVAVGPEFEELGYTTLGESAATARPERLRGYPDPRLCRGTSRVARWRRCFRRARRPLRCGRPMAGTSFSRGSKTVISHWPEFAPTACLLPRYCSSRKSNRLRSRETVRNSWVCWTSNERSW